MAYKYEAAILKYVEELKRQFNSGQAKEHAYRPALKDLMSSFDDVTAVNDPKRSAHGNPDFIFLNPKNKDIIHGYAEAKDVDISLDKTENTDQLHRYAGYENLFLSNYIEFRFYQNGNKYQTIEIGQIKNSELVLKPENYQQLVNELANFISLPPETIRSGKRLAEIMGAKARRIRDNVIIYLEHTDDEKNQELEKMFTMMRELLVHDLTIEKFADMYAQTLVYGLFVARYGDKTPDNFTRSEARDLVPASNPFLREFFDHIVGPRFDVRLAHIVDELCEVFSVSDVKNIINKHLKLYTSGNEKDPIIHFYEDFLKEYDPAERKKMGAYYTPLPVVRFIVKSVDEILKKEFNIPKGLADTEKKKITVERQGKTCKIDLHRVQILDPAVGTATFLNEVIKHIYATFKGQEGRWSSYVERDLLPRLYGFELMMAPYTIAHLKLGMTLQETGVEDFKQRIGVYLTNTLEEGIKRQPDLFSYGLAEVVSDEAHEASIIKHEKPIMVIVGNPPYSGESSNKTEYAQSLVDKYKFEPGGRIKLQERNPKWINDDYVKFIAFAEDMIEKNGDGVLGMITNHAYLDNPTFRGMRWHLAKTFDKIYILDLHGNAKKKEISPDGSKDENVFDIMQGVSIILAVKNNQKKKEKPAEVYCADIFGSRKNKFKALDGNIKWKKIELDKKFFYLVDKNTEGRAEYENGIAINELFSVNSVGIITSSDSILIADSEERLIKQILDAKGNPQNGKIYDRLQKHDIEQNNIDSIAYRPFDDRLIYYSPDVIERSRINIMQHMLQKNNIALVAAKLNRQISLGYYFVTNKLTDFHILDSAADSTFTLPLYLYRDDGTKMANLNQIVLKNFTKNILEPYEPEAILDYIYAVLYSPKYREKYKEFLKIDFPKIPAPKNDTEFVKLAKLGKELRELHLMTSSKVNDFITTFPATGNNLVDKLTYENGNVYINNGQYFGNVPELAWNFYIGGYQPAQKWLKDRKGRTLDNEDIEHYQKIIKILVETGRIMKEIG